MKRALWLLWTAALTAAAGTAIVWVCVGRFGETEARIILCLIGVFLALTSAVAALRLLDMGRLRLVAMLALAAVPLEMAAFVDGSWYGTFGDGIGKDGKWYITAFAWAIASLIVITLGLLLRDPRLQRTIFPLTFLFAGSAAAVVTVLVWANVNDNDWGRALAGLSIAKATSWLIGAFGQRALTRGDPAKA